LQKLPNNEKNVIKVQVKKETLVSGFACKEAACAAVERGCFGSDRSQFVMILAESVLLIHPPKLFMVCLFQLSSHVLKEVND
jgi:hypothetical protein